MTDIITIPQTEEEQEEQVLPLLERLFKHLTELTVKAANKSEPWKMYFSGEFDSNQTAFERASNHLEIGVIANNKTTGVILLRLLRILTDSANTGAKYLDLLWPSRLEIEEGEDEDWPADLPKDGTKVPFKWLINMLAESETAYLTTGSLNDSFKTTLCGYKNGQYNETVIEKRLDEVDAWTLKRIENAMYDRY
jgi:hypothetical protein